MMERVDYIFGRHPVMEALKARPREVIRIFISAAGETARLRDIEQLAHKQDVPIVVVPKRKLDDLVGLVAHQGLVAATTAFAYVAVEDLIFKAKKQTPLLLALDQIQDPQNLGALIRSCYALGGHGLILPKDRAAQVTPAVVKAAAGATSYLPIAQVTNMRRSLDDLKSEGIWVMGTVANGGETIDAVDLTCPIVIVVGSEGSGLRRLVAETCDRLVHIPMAGSLASLNASVAGALLLYEAVRQRRLKGKKSSP